MTTAMACRDYGSVSIRGLRGALPAYDDPVPGALRHIGCAGGVDCYEIEPSADSWILVTAADIHSDADGASVLAAARGASLVLLSRAAVLRVGRRRRPTVYVDGVVEYPDEPVNFETAVDPVSAPPSALAAALSGFVERSV